MSDLACYWCGKTMQRDDTGLCRRLVCPCGQMLNVDIALNYPSFGPAATLFPHEKYFTEKILADWERYERFMASAWTELGVYTEANRDRLFGEIAAEVSRKRQEWANSWGGRLKRFLKQLVENA